MAQVLAHPHRKVLLLGSAIRPDLLLQSGVALLDAAAQKAEDLLAAPGAVPPKAGSQNLVVAQMVDLHLLDALRRHSHRKGLQTLLVPV